MTTTTTMTEKKQTILRYVVDMEFAEDPKGVRLPEIISIAVVCLDDERELYLENIDFSPDRANDWVRKYVLPKLQQECPAGVEWWRRAHPCGDPTCRWSTPHEMAVAVRAFCTEGDTIPEFWGYMCAHDFVLLERLFGDFEHWPKGWPFVMFDLEQLRTLFGLPMPQQPEEGEHHALTDARFLAGVYRTFHQHPLMHMLAASRAQAAYLQSRSSAWVGGGNH